LRRSVRLTGTDAWPGKSFGDLLSVFLDHVRVYVLTLAKASGTEWRGPRMIVVQPPIPSFVNDWQNSGIQLIRCPNRPADEGRARIATCQEPGLLLPAKRSERSREKLTRRPTAPFLQAGLQWTGRCHRSFSGQHVAMKKFIHIESSRRVAPGHVPVTGQSQAPEERNVDDYNSDRFNLSERLDRHGKWLTLFEGFSNQCRGLTLLGYWLWRMGPRALSRRARSRACFAGH